MFETGSKPKANRRRRAIARGLALGAALGATMALAGCEQASVDEAGVESLGSTSEAIIVSTCGSISSDFWTNEIIADMAGAAAMELGRWMPNDDFIYDATNGLQLSEEGQQQCLDVGNNCPHLSALMFMQRDETAATSAMYPIPNHDPANLRALLGNYWTELQNGLSDTFNNNPGLYPVPNRMTQTGTYGSGPQLRTFQLDRTHVRAMNGDTAICDEAGACPLASSNEEGHRIFGTEWGLSRSLVNPTDSNACLAYANGTLGDSVVSFKFGYDDHTGSTRAYVYSTTSRTGNACTSYTTGGQLFNGTYQPLLPANLYYCKA